MLETDKSNDGPIIDIPFRERKYLDISDRSKFMLSWSLEGQILSTTLEDFCNIEYDEDKIYNLYRAKPFSNVSDEILGEAIAVFSYDNITKWGLLYTPSILRWGMHSELPRKAVALQKTENNLLLPYRFYLLKTR